MLIIDQATQVKSPAPWDSMKIALRPVYSPSTIMNDKVERVNESTSEYAPRYAEAWNIPSGNIPHRPKRSQKEFRRNHQHRERL